MAIVRFTCPECDEVFKVGAAPAPGKKVKCPECKHAFVPPSEDDEEEEDEDDEEPPAKAKSSPKKAAPKKRPRDDDDDDEDEDEDEDEEEEDDAPRRKKKKKSPGINVLYWVYRGVSILVLLILLGVLAWVLFFRRTPLNIEMVVPILPADTKYETIDPSPKSQDVNINAQATSGQFDIYVFLEKDKGEVEKALLTRKPSAKILASQLNKQSADLRIPVPANESATVRLSSSDGKKAEVKLKFTN